MAKKKRIAVDNAVQSIIDSGGNSVSNKKTKEGKTKVLSGRVDVEGVADRFEAAADNLGVKPGTLLSYLVEKFLKDWDEGKRPKKRKKTIEVLELE